MSRSVIPICVLAVLALVAMVGCDDDSVAPSNEWVVLNPQSSRFEGLVQISEQVVETSGTNRTEVILQGTVTNFGPDLDGARLELIVADVATRLDGTTVYLDERPVASVDLGTLHRNRSLSVNLRWTHSSTTPLRFSSRFSSGVSG